MAEITVKQLAGVVGAPVERLLEQIKDAGLTASSEADLISDRPNIKAWFDRITTHKSFSGQNIIAYDLLPKLADIKNKQLSSIVIDDF